MLRVTHQQLHQHHLGNNVATMMNLTHIQNWIFDLDNTLYPAHCQLFTQISQRITRFVIEALNLSENDAQILQEQYRKQYGTTLSGLMRDHDIVAEDFLGYVHDIDVSAVKPNLALAEVLQTLPGRRFIYTNGSVKHAQNITVKLGINHVFDDIFDIKAAQYLPKPHRQSYDQFLSLYDVDPERSVMFEDLAVNLEVPHALGMETVLICEDADLSKTDLSSKTDQDLAPHIGYATTDLTRFLAGVMTSA